MRTIRDLNAVDQQAIGEFQDRVRDLLAEKLCSLRLFGSKVRGTDTVDSDIDIFVVVQDDSFLTKRAIIDAAFDVNLKYDVYISPRVVPRSLYENSLFHTTPFVQGVERQSIPL